MSAVKLANPFQPILNHARFQKSISNPPSGEEGNDISERTAQVCNFVNFTGDLCIFGFVYRV